MRIRPLLATLTLTIFGVASALAPASSANWSNNNIAYTRGYLQNVVSLLQTSTDRDYNGHRATAIQNISTAQYDLQQALNYNRAHGGRSNPSVLAPSNANMYPVPQGQSNRNVRQSVRYLQAAIGMLQQDQTRYGGWRTKAIASLQSAISNLQQALRFNGNTGGNSNMQYTRWYIGRAISNLQYDQRDYGGHRVNAINDLQQAANQIQHGLVINRQTGDFNPQQPPNANGAWMRPQRNSNQNMRNVRQMIQSAISMLQRDPQTYGGYRNSAINSLQSALGEVNAALSYYRGHR